MSDAVGEPDITIGDELKLRRRRMQDEIGRGKRRRSRGRGLRDDLRVMTGELESDGRDGDELRQQPFCVRSRTSRQNSLPLGV